MNNALVYRIDRAYGSFDRRFILQDNADAEKVNADFNDGVVKLHIARAKRLDPSKIEAKISGTAPDRDAQAVRPE